MGANIRLTKRQKLLRQTGIRRRRNCEHEDEIERSKALGRQSKRKRGETHGIAARPPLKARPEETGYAAPKSGPRPQPPKYQSWNPSDTKKYKKDAPCTVLESCHYEDNKEHPKNTTVETVSTTRRSERQTQKKRERDTRSNHQPPKTTLARTKVHVKCRK